MRSLLASTEKSGVVLLAAIALMCGCAETPRQKEFRETRDAYAKKMQEGKIAFTADAIEPFINKYIATLSGSACGNDVSLEIKIKPVDLRTEKFSNRTGWSWSELERYRAPTPIDGTFTYNTKSAITAPIVGQVKGYVFPFGPMVHLEAKNFSLDVGRGEKPNEWSGSIDINGYLGCDEVKLSHAGEQTGFAQVNADLAEKRALALDSKSGLKHKIYWLSRAEKMGKDEVPKLAEAYMEMGKRDPEAYKSAFRYYQLLNDRGDDLEVQRVIARMYGDGLGVARNLPEAKRLRDIIMAVERKTAEICAAPQSLKAIQSIITGINTESRVMGTIMTAITGITVDPGSLRIMQITPERVVSLSKPFYCEVIAKRIDPEIDASTMPHYVYVTTSNYGVTVRDNSFERAAANLGANIVQNILSKVPVRTSIKVTQTGVNMYRLEDYGLFRKQSVNIELNPPRK